MVEEEGGVCVGCVWILNVENRSKPVTFKELSHNMVLIFMVL